MKRQTLFPDPDCLHLQHAETDTATITIVVTTVAEETACPTCGQCSSKVHSRYSRTPADLPWLGCAVRLRLHARRFFCTNPACHQKIYTERLPQVVAPYARHWMLCYVSVPEKIAAVSASEDIFVQICARVGPALIGNYGMSAEQVAFFTAHEEIGVNVTPIDTLLLARYDTPEDRQRITRAVRLSHEFELLFYDTAMAVTPSEK